MIQIVKSLWFPLSGNESALRIGCALFKLVLLQFLFSHRKWIHSICLTIFLYRFIQIIKILKGISPHFFYMASILVRIRFQMCESVYNPFPSTNPFSIAISNTSSNISRNTSVPSNLLHRFWLIVDACRTVSPNPSPKKHLWHIYPYFPNSEHIPYIYPINSILNNISGSIAGLPIIRTIQRI